MQEGGYPVVTLVGILTEIEELRQSMHHITFLKGTTADQEVLAVSQKLDAALITYHRMKHGYQHETRISA
jgi:hypothetical protein